MYVERFSSVGGILQSVDSRVKLCSFTAFIIVAVAARTIVPLIILFILVTSLSVASKIPLKFFFLRATTFIPVFAAIIALPLPFITPGTPLARIGYGELFVYITTEGVYRAVQFTFKVWICVASSTLLFLTTRFSSFLRAMAIFRIPRIFTMMIAVTYRFIFVFINEAYQMFLAKEARTVTKERRLRVRTLKTLANMISTLFIRAYERGEKVYLAMLARGYAGEAKSLGKMRCSRKDWFFGIALILICFITLLIEFTALGGI